MKTNSPMKKESYFLLTLLTLAATAAAEPSSSAIERDKNQKPVATITITPNAEIRRDAAGKIIETKTVQRNGDGSITETRRDGNGALISTTTRRK